MYTKLYKHPIQTIISICFRFIIKLIQTKSINKLYRRQTSPKYIKLLLFFSIIFSVCLNHSRINKKKFQFFFQKYFQKNLFFLFFEFRKTVLQFNNLLCIFPYKCYVRNKPFCCYSVIH